jgi:hypothetical protein
VIPPDLAEIDKVIIEDGKHFVIEMVRETLVTTDKAILNLPAYNRKKPNHLTFLF